MKTKLLFLFLLLSSIRGFCQDTLKTIFTEEIDTLSPVRFIDRYENIFMTKVPTRHMFKVGLSQYIQSKPFALYNEKGFKNSALQLGYEFKLLPAFSVGISGQMPLFGNAIPKTWIPDNISFNGQVRWYYDMKERIATGKSANNFSGNYLAAEYSYLGKSTNLKAVGLRLGFQRRFLNSGFIDLSIGLRKELPNAHKMQSAGWGVFTEVNLGLAVGDWKKTSKPMLCELIRCDQQTRQHWKIQIPDIKFGRYQKTLGFGVGYEVAVGKSPVSLNFQCNINLQRANNYLYGYFYNQIQGGWFAANTLSKERSQQYSIQPRYYIMQNAKQRRGMDSNRLSGIYSGINLEYAVYNGSHFVERRYEPHNGLWMREYKFNVNESSYRVGPLLGMQQRLFKNGYIDFNTSCNWDHIKEWGETIIRVRANLTIGFAFGS
jgi:hypothetical protein